MIVKIFVSSLFREMAIERDVLHRQVSAMLVNRLDGTGIIPDFIDLRWGLDDSGIASFEEKSAFIIEKCFEAIDDCDIFLAMIGKEYGSLADREVCRAQLPWLSFERDYSFTDMELEYAKAKLPPERILFLHTEESEEDDPEVRRIKREFSTRYRHAAYRKEEGAVDPSFISGAVSLIADALKKEGEIPLHASGYFRRKELLDTCLSRMETENLVMLCGASGSGKSILAKMLEQELSVRKDIALFSVFQTCREKSDLRTLLHDMFGFEGDLRAILRLLSEHILSSAKKCMILLDDIDGFDLNDLFAMYEALVSIPKERFSLLFSSADPRYRAYFLDLSVFMVEVGDLTKQETLAFLAYISDRYHKQYYGEVFDYITEKGFSNPLCLSMLMNRLITLDTSKYRNAGNHTTYTAGIVAEMKQVIDTCPEEPEEVIAWNLADLDNFIFPQFTTFLFTAMSIYRKPLPLPIVKRLYETMFDRTWSELDYYTYRFYLREFCDTINHALVFKHDIIRKLVHKRILSAENKSKYHTAFASVLAEPALCDRTMLYYFSILEKDTLWLEGIDSPFRDDAARALLMAADGELNGESEPIVLSAFRSLLAENMGEATVSLFIILLRYLSLYGRLDAAYTLYRALFDSLYSAISSPSLKMRLLSGMLDFANAKGLEDRFHDLPNSFVELLGSYENGLAEEEVALVLECSYISTMLCRATDREEDYPRLLVLTSELLSLSPTLSYYAPPIVEMLEKQDIEAAKRVALAQVERHRDTAETSEEIQALGNLYYRLHTMYLREKKIEEADRYALLCHGTLCAREDREQMSAADIYDYTVGLGAYGFHCSIRHMAEEEASTYTRIFSLRNHLAKIEPDHFIALAGLANTVLNILGRGIPVALPISSMVETVTEHMFRYARRGNPRVGWLFAHFFKDVLTSAENTGIAELMLEKFKELDLMLLPIIRQNRLQPENLTELVRVYLEIYTEYCNKRILPLEDGKQLLCSLAEAARDAIRSHRAEHTFSLYYELYLEIQTIFLQQSDSILFTQSELYLRHTAFMTECDAMPPSPALSLFLTLRPAAEIMTYVYMHQNIENGDPMKKMMFDYMMKHLGVDVFGEIKKNMLAVFEAVKEYPGLRHRSVELMSLGLQYLAKHSLGELKKPEIREVLRYLQTC